MDGCEYELTIKIKSTDDNLSMSFLDKLNMDESSKENNPIDVIYSFRSMRPDIIHRTVIQDNTGSNTGIHDDYYDENNDKDDAEIIFSRSPGSLAARHTSIRENRDFLKSSMDIVMELEREDALKNLNVVD